MLQRVEMRTWGERRSGQTYTRQRFQIYIYIYMCSTRVLAVEGLSGLRVGGRERERLLKLRADDLILRRICSNGRCVVVVVEPRLPLIPDVLEAAQSSKNEIIPF